jgi:DNA modification methylase
MIKPYYESDGIVIYHGDCREILPALDANVVDLVLTDPPYGINKADWDDEFPTWWLDEAARVAPAMGLMPGVWNLLKCPQTVGRLRYRWTLSAHLTNGMTRGGIGFGNWIPCLVYSAADARAWCSMFARWCKANGVTRAALDVAAGTSDMGGWWCSTLPHRSQIPTPEQWLKLKEEFDPPEEFETLVYANPYQADGDCRGFVVGDEPKFKHPSPKPQRVVSWFLSRLPGRSVLDPFAGTGTTLRAAKDLGRRAVGVEVEERYCEMAANRLAQGVFQFAEDAP